MKRLLLLSWICIVMGSAMIIVPQFGEMSPRLSVWFAIGNMLLVAPNAIWILASNRVVATELKTVPSRVVTGLTLVFLTAFAITFCAIGALSTKHVSKLSEGLGEAALGFCFILAFVSLITSSIFVSRRIIDADEHPQAGRASRIFVLVICFFYVAIGMFFIASKLKKIQMKKSTGDGPQSFAG